MIRLIQLRQTTSVFLVASALGCFWLLPAANAADPATPDTALPGGNTADGNGALFSLTTSIYNSAFGLILAPKPHRRQLLHRRRRGGTLGQHRNSNAAFGAAALLNNHTASDNNAVGTFALFNNDSDAAGLADFNNAHGRNCLLNNVDGDENDAFGDDAMEENTTGDRKHSHG